MWTPLARSTSASPGGGDGHAEHPCHRAPTLVDLERGVRRNGKLIAGDIQRHIGTIRTIAQHEHLSETCLERIEPSAWCPKRATIEFVSGMCTSRCVRWTWRLVLRHACPAHFPHSISIAWPRPRVGHRRRAAAGAGGAHAHSAL